MSSWIAYFAYRLVETIARLLPAPMAWRMGAALGWVALWLSPRYRRLVTRNLTIAFGEEMSPEEIRKLVKKHMVYLGGNFVAGMKMPFMKPEHISRYLEIEGFEGLSRSQGRGTGGVYVLMHMGNWEILTQSSFILKGTQSGGLYQPLHNKPLNAHVLRLRQRTGSKLFNRQEGYHAPVDFVKKNNILAVLADQRAGESGVWCPFFGRLASTTTLPALVAKRAGAPMYPVGVITTGPGRWKAVFGPELPVLSKVNSPEEAAAEMNLALEKIIRLSPADWFWVHNRWKTPNPEFLLANKKRGLALPISCRVEDLQPFEIVVRAPDTLSDACLSLPAVRAIRRGRPDGRITVLARQSQADLWRMDPEVDEVISVPDGAATSECAAALKATGRWYDAGILFSDTRRAAEELSRGGVNHLTGYEGEGRRKLLDQVIAQKKNPGPVQHRERDFLRIALRIGANIDDPSLHEPLALPALPPERHTIIGLCPGGSFGESQRWPVERWAEAAKLVSSRAHVHWVILGSAEETDAGARLAGLIGAHCTDLTGKTSLPDLANTLRRCRAVVTHDSGPLQLAVLLGVPSISLFGPTESALTGPQNAPHTVIRRHVECSPCFLATCPLDHHRCMMEIPAQRVADAILTHCQTPARV